MSSFPFIISLFILLLSIALSSDYFVESFIDNSNVFGKVPDPDQSTKFVTFLGEYTNEQDCITACVSNVTIPENRCQSFTYMTSSYYVNTYRRHCYGLFGKQYGSVWTYVSDKGATTGRIIYPCIDDTDCSANGVCSSKGNCTCNFGWTGYKCGVLNFDKAKKGSGYVNINNVSSWGGAVLVDDADSNEDTRYHMYFSQFDNHCGVNAWVPNSKVVHARSTQGFNSPYLEIDTIHSHFSHEPDAIRGPNGEYVLYYIAGNITGNGKECVCKDGSTPDACDPGNVPQPFTVVMQYSSTVNGPWSEPIQVIQHSTSPCDDPNLAGVILKNGTFVGLVRDWEAGFSTVYPIRSDDWKDAQKYKIDVNTNVFPQLIGGGTEDQFMYVDCDGRYHTIWNNQSPVGDVSLCGAHAYSIDLVNWIYTGLAFDNDVTWEDGTTTSFLRRERPHLVFSSKDKCTPIALTNAVDYGGTHGDASYTLLHPLKTD